MLLFFNAIALFCYKKYYTDTYKLCSVLLFLFISGIFHLWKPPLTSAEFHRTSAKKEKEIRLRLYVHIRGCMCHNWQARNASVLVCPGYGTKWYVIIRSKFIVFSVNTVLMSFSVTVGFGVWWFLF